MVPFGICMIGLSLDLLEIVHLSVYDLTFVLMFCFVCVYIKQWQWPGVYVSSCSHAHVMFMLRENSMKNQEPL